MAYVNYSAYPYQSKIRKAEKVRCIIYVLPTLQFPLSNMEIDVNRCVVNDMIALKTLWDKDPVI
jgi:hypothetical protein